MAKYRARIADGMLDFKLQSKGAVLVEGAKWCGKTTTAERAARSILYMSDPATREQNMLAASINPAELLKGEAPRLIDEWQLAPNLWDAVRFEVDHRKAMGQFILTGSSTPADKSKIFHSGTGRFSWLKMRPMSLMESGESNGSVSLKGLCRGEFEVKKNDFYDIHDLAFVACRGGWPAAVDLAGDVALVQAEDYLTATVHDDISRVDGVQRDPERTRRLLRSYARLQGGAAPIATIAADMAANEADDADRGTVAAYIEALKKIFVIEDSVAWNPNLRSKTAIRTSDARYFVDPSIATAALGVGPDQLVGDLNLFGFIFETLCVRDIRVYAEGMGATVYHYHDKRGLECDAVVVLKNGDYGLVEVKLGGDELIEEGAQHLNAVAEDLVKSPLFKAVVTGTSMYSVMRPDGVCVVPIGCLGV